MLPAHIIEKILERERQVKQQQPLLELELPLPYQVKPPAGPEHVSDRGVFTIDLA